MTSVAQTATLVHGYTMAEVDRIARVAVRKHWRSSGIFDFETRAEIAWDAIVVELYSSAYDPEFIGLLSAGMTALDYALNEERHHHGLTDRMDAAPNFAKYWLPVGRQVHNTDDGFSDHLCEIMSLPSALSVLTGEQYEAIATLAAFDNRAGYAADALGLKYQGFMYRVYSARAKIKAVWFDDEEPVRSRPTGETCRVGHSRAQHGTQQPNGTWVCRACKRATNRRSAARRRVRPEADVAGVA